jgi:hypothetical protein
MFDFKTAATQWEPKCPLDLVVAYEDSFTRDRALQLYDQICKQLLDEYDFQCSWWKLEYLQSRTLFEQAADAATSANMVILSLRAGEEIPSLAAEWIDSWVPRKEQRKSALVVLIAEGDARANGSSGVQNSLRAVARKAGMDFFFHMPQCPSDKTSAEKPRYSRETISQRAATVTPVLEEILHQPKTDTKWFRL